MGGGMQNELTSACTRLEKENVSSCSVLFLMLPLSFQSGQQLRLR